MPADNQPPDKLSIVVFSGAFDKVHYALAMAAASLAVNTPATLFFTMGASRALLAEDADGPGWRHLHPTEDGVAPVELRRLRGIAGGLRRLGRHHHGL